MEKTSSTEFIESDFLDTVSVITDDNLNHNRHVKVIRIDKNGKYDRISMPTLELLRHFDVEDGKLHRTLASVFRDFRIFVNHQKYNTDSRLSSERENGPSKEVAHPRILPRPGTEFFLVDLFFLKIFCRADYCFVLDHDENFDHECRHHYATCEIPVLRFVTSLVQNIEHGAVNSALSPSIMKEFAQVSSMVKGGVERTPFELMVLETALDILTETFREQFCVLRYILDKLLYEMDPREADQTTRKIVAFKKPIAIFGNRVDTVKQAIFNLLAKDSDMAELYLSQKTHRTQHEEVELFLEGYHDDLHVLQLKVMSLFEQISDHRRFNMTRLDENRNQIMNITLIMEVCMLGIGTGTLISGIFGMNLKSRLEEHPFAFYATVGAVFIFCAVVVVIFLKSINSIEGKFILKSWKFPILQNFLSYIDDITVRLRNRQTEGVTKSRFEDFMSEIALGDFSSEEVAMLFNLFDSDSSGIIHPETFIKSVASSRKKKELKQILKEKAEQDRPEFPHPEEISRFAKMEAKQKNRSRSSENPGRLANALRTFLRRNP